MALGFNPLPSPVLRYGSAILAVAVALVLGLLLHPFDGPSAFLLFFGAVSLAAWYGRLGPSLVAIVLSVLALDFFLLPPLFSLGTGITDTVSLAVFILLALLMNSLHARQQRLERTLAATEDEIRLARQIQQRMLSVPVPVFATFDIAGVCLPAGATGGDYFDYIPMADGCLGIAIGDVSGHGFGPALLMAETHAFLRALALTHGDVGVILTLANRLVFDDTDDDQFVTLFFGRLNPQTREFHYAGAGHQAYLLDAGGSTHRLASTGLPLGVEETAIVACAPPLRLEDDQVVVLLTDGIFEARAADGSLFGVARALEFVRANRCRTARQIVESLCQAVQNFTPSVPQADDLTAVVIKTRPTA